MEKRSPLRSAMKIDVAGEDLGDLDRDGVRDARLVGGGEQRGLDDAADQTGRGDQRRGLHAGDEAVAGLLDHQALEGSGRRSGDQRAVRRNRRLSSVASIRTLRPARPSKAWRAMVSERRWAAAGRVIDAQALEQAVGAVAGAGQVGAVETQGVFGQFVDLRLHRQRFDRFGDLRDHEIGRRPGPAMRWTASRRPAAWLPQHRSIASDAVQSRGRRQRRSHPLRQEVRESIRVSQRYCCQRRRCTIAAVFPVRHRIERQEKRKLYRRTLVVQAKKRHECNHQDRLSR